MQKKFKIHQTQYNAKDIDTIEGDIRLYKISDEIKYPSITSVLSRTMSREKEYILEKWKEFIGGDEEAEKVRIYSTDRGSKVHNLLEEYVLNSESFQDSYDKSDGKTKRLFNQIKKILEKVDNIRLIEKPLFSNKLKCAGRVDLIAEYEGKLSIIDFKTSTKVKSISEVIDYFVQESFYAHCYYEMYGEKIEQLVTIIATENSLHAKVFVDKPENFFKKLISKIKQFYGVKDE